MLAASPKQVRADAWGWWRDGVAELAGDVRCWLRHRQVAVPATEVNMVARTSTWSGSSETLDKWEAHVKNQVSGFVATFRATQVARS